jgi:HAMP domain-containing protein
MILQAEVGMLKNGPLAEVFTPVYDLDGRPLGVIRLTSRVVTVLDQVYQLRYLLAAILALGVLAGLGLGSYLALSLERPIKRVADSIQELAAGSRQLQVEEQGPQEIRSLAHSFNVLVVQLNSLEQARRQLLANLVHEIGRPLGAIRSAIQALVNGAMDDPQLSSPLTGLTARPAPATSAGRPGRSARPGSGTLELNHTRSAQDWLEIASPWEAAALKRVAWTLETSPTCLGSSRPRPSAQALGNLPATPSSSPPPVGRSLSPFDRLKMSCCWKWSIRVRASPRASRRRSSSPSTAARRAAASCRAWVSASASPGRSPRRTAAAWKWKASQPGAAVSG